jgi:hypothetical protein
MRPCACKVVDLACRVCYLWQHDPVYREHWNGDPADVTPALKPWQGKWPAVALPPPPPRNLPCVHRSAISIGTVPCPTCAGTVNLKVFACEVHGRCVVAANNVGLKACAGCGEYQAATSKIVSGPPHSVECP